MGDREVSFTVRIKDAATAALAEVEKSAAKVTEKLFGLKDILGAVAAAAASISLVELAKDMIDLGVTADKTFRQIAASLPTFHQGLDQLKEDIEALANASGRSLESMEQSAAAIAKLGVSSAEELKQQLEASTKLADATGTSVDEAAQLLIQLRREFNLTGEEALETAAKLASAAQGKVAITELFSAFQQSAPIFQKFNIDIDTGTKAIIALVERGMGIRQIRGELNALDADGIKQLATQATIASDAMGQLSRRAAEVETGAARAAMAVKNQLTAALEDFGLAVVTRAIPGLSKMALGIQALKDQLQDKGWLQTFVAIAGGIFGTQSQVDKILAPTGNPLDNDPSLAASVASQNRKAPGARPALPMTAADKKAIEEAALAEQKLNLELENTARAEAVATEKALELAQAQGVDLKLAIESALGAATGHLAEAAAAAIDDRATKLTREIVLNEALDMATKERMLHEIELTRQIQQAQNAATPVLDRGSLTLSSIGIPGHTTQGDLTALMAQEQALLAADRAIVAVGGDDAKVKAQLLEIDKKRAEIQKGMVADGAAAAATSVKTAEEQKRQVLEMAQAWSAVGRSIIAGAQAVGQMDAATAAALQNVVSLGDGIVQLFSGNIGQGIAETATSLAALAKSLFTGDNAEAKAHAKVLEDNSTALRHLADTIKGVQLLPGAFAAAGQAIGALIGRGSTAGSQYAFGGIGVKADLSGLTPLQIDKLNAAAKALGIVLDGTEASFLQLKAAIDAAEPSIEAAYEEQQKQIQEDLRVRELRAEGLTQEADALEFALKQQREYNAAVAAGADEDTIAALKATQAAEAAAFLASQVGSVGDAMQAAADAIAAAVKQVNDALSALNDYNDVHGVTDPYDQISGTAKTAGEAGGAIDLSGYDLTTQAGRDAALGALRTAWDDSAGNPAFRIVLKTLIDEIYRLPPIADAGGATGAAAPIGHVGAGGFGIPGVSALSNSFAGLTNVQGDRLADLELREVGYLASIDANIAKMVMRVPSYPGVGIGSVAGMMGGAVVIQSMSVDLGSSSSMTPEQQADRFAAELRRLNVALGRQVVVQKVYNGDISVTPS